MGQKTGSRSHSTRTQQPHLIHQYLPIGQEHINQPTNTFRYTIGNQVQRCEGRMPWKKGASKMHYSYELIEVRQVCCNGKDDSMWVFKS